MKQNHLSSYFLELQVDIQVSKEDCHDDGTINIRQKKQMVTGPHKGRCQRLERKAWKFFLLSLHQSLSPSSSFNIYSFVRTWDNRFHQRVKAIRSFEFSFFPLSEKVVFGCSDTNSFSLLIVFEHFYRISSFLSEQTRPLRKEHYVDMWNVLTIVLCLENRKL